MELKKAGLILLLGAIGTKIGGTLFKFILINQLDPLLYGEFAIFLILFNWLTLIATFSITIGLTKFVSELRGNKKLYYIVALLGCTIISLVLSLTLILFRSQISSFMNIGNNQIILFLAAVLPFAVFYDLTIFYFRGLYKMKSSAFSDIVLSTVRILILIFALYMGYQNSTYLAFLLSFIFVDIMLVFSNFKNSVKIVPAKNMFEMFKKLFLYSLPIFVSESLRLFGLGFDRIFLAKFYTASASGIYDVGITLCLGYTLIANSYANALLPIASKSQRDQNKLKKSLVKASLYVVGLYIAYSAIILLLARPIITIVNPAYLDITEFLLPLIVAYSLIGFLSLLSHFVNAINLQKYAVISSALFVLNCFMLNFYFVPQLKYLGAVNAILISALISVILLTLLIWRRLKLKK